MPWWAQTLINGVGIFGVALLSGTWIGKHLQKRLRAMRDELWELHDKADAIRCRVALVAARQRGLESTEQERLRWISYYLEETSGE